MPKSDFIEVLETLESLQSDSEDVKEALEHASDSVAFVETLTKVFEDNGLISGDEVSIADLEAAVDCMMGELVAASMFLSDPAFAPAPDSLRAIQRNLEKSEEPIPAVVVRGFGRFAKRVENTRLSVSHFKSLLGNP